MQPRKGLWKKKTKQFCRFCVTATAVQGHTYTYKVKCHRCILYRSNMSATFGRRHRTQRSLVFATCLLSTLQLLVEFSDNLPQKLTVPKQGHCEGEGQIHTVTGMRGFYENKCLLTVLNHIKQCIIYFYVTVALTNHVFFSFLVVCINSFCYYTSHYGTYC